MTAPLRKDAARNWERITSTARQLVDDGVPLQLNEIARLTGVGVATVYRHFPSAEALLETVAAPSLEALVAQGEQALLNDDAWAALAGFLAAVLDAQMLDLAVSPVSAAATNVLPRITQLKITLATIGGQLLDKARDAGAIRADVTESDIVPLMCGIAYAATAHDDSKAGRATTARRYLDLLLAGLRPR
jgi:AcrR family transcriptional regulator